MASGALGSIAGSAFQMYGGGFSHSAAGVYAFAGLAGGIGSAATGGNFWQGMGIGLMNAGLNHVAQEAAENAKLRKYVDAMFPGRVPEGSAAQFRLFAEDGGETQLQKPHNVSISRKYWFSKDNRLLIDCIDHELVHLGDLESGRAAKYYQVYKSQEKMINIMEYRAFSQNQYYNLNHRTPDMRYNYAPQVDYYKRLLPPGWKTIK